MLKEYKEYMNLEPINEEVIKPDPPGANEIYNSKSYNDEFSKILNDAMAKVKEEATINMAKKLENDWKGKIISFEDNSGKQKIVEVVNVIVENKGQDYYPVIVEDKDRKFRFGWENGGKRSTIHDVGKFLDFFEKYYLGNLLMFQGKPLKGGGDFNKMIKTPIRIGKTFGSSQDFIIMECDDDTTVFLQHTAKIKIMDEKIKTLDPYGEENWDN